MLELKKYGENIEAMREKIGAKDKSFRMIMLKDKSGRFGGASSHNSPSKKEKHQQPQASELFSKADRISFTPPVVEVTPSLGERESGRDNRGGGSISDAEASSPGTPPSLQIDLEGSGHGSGGSGGGTNVNRSRIDKSPSRGRAMPSGGRSLIGTINRNSQVPGSLDFSSDSGLQAVLMGSPTICQAGGLKKRKGTLLDVISGINQRKLGGGGSGWVAGPPAKSGAGVTSTEGGGGTNIAVEVRQDDTDVAKQKGALADDSQGKTSSPFSSIYADRNKTAIALVDPNQKRPKRKTAKVVGSEPPSKKARLNNNAVSGTQGSAGAGTKADSSSASAGDLQAISDTAAYVAKIQEYGSTVVGAFSTNTNIVTTTITTTTIPPSTTSTIPSSTIPSSTIPTSTIPTSTIPTSTIPTSTIPPSTIPPSTSIIPPSTTTIPSTTSTVLPSTSASSNTLASLQVEFPTVGTSLSSLPNGTSSSIAVSSNGSGSTLAPPTAVKPRSSTSSGGKRKKKGSDKNRGKSPHKPSSSVTKTMIVSAPKITPSAAVVDALAAATTTPLTVFQPPSSSAATFTLASTISSSCIVSTSQGGNLPYQGTQGASTTQDSPSSSGSAEVRGEVAARGVGQEDSSDFAEGTGLLADTVRKVNTSFLARVNQITGTSEDMGYKYFMEKVGVLIH